MTIAGTLVLISKKGEILILTAWTDSSLELGGRVRVKRKVLPKDTLPPGHQSHQDISPNQSPQEDRAVTSQLGKDSRGALCHGMLVWDSGTRCPVGTGQSFWFPISQVCC